MKANQTIAALFVGAGFAAAQNATAQTGPGPFPAAEASQFEDAEEVASKSVEFDLWYPSEEGNDAPRWTWTTRLEEAAISDSDIPNAVQLNTVYQFSWPDEGTLQNAVAQNSGQLSQENFCVTVLESNFPNNRVNRFDADTEDNASDGSCSGPIRDPCFEAIASAFRDAEVGENGCRGTDLDLAEIHQCEWEFEGTYRASTYNLLANSTAEQAANETFPLSSGGGFAHITSDTYDSENRTLFEQAELRVHMVIIDSGSVFEPICMRVDAERNANSAASAGVNFWFIGSAALAALAYML